MVGLLPIDLILTIGYLDSSGVLESELASIWFSFTLWETKSGSASDVHVTSTWSSIISRDIGNTWLGSGIKAETARGWVREWVVLRFMSLVLWGHVSLLRNKVVNTFFELHFL